ncbi:hypothetical protein KNE206_29490 [Kitasatospora sp. NE20-6]|uniref:hypothetical protein n=1 Tax=Kitasatospora sp. NE20-6 TaxID=2859066 RepID=UPI0034DBC7C1
MENWSSCASPRPERAGRTDEAVEVLRAERASGRRHPVNFPEGYAELLAWQGLIEELGALAVEDHRSALDVYAKALEDAGRADEAEAVLRNGIEAHDHPKDRAALMRLLVRHGRVDEAVETGRPTYEYYDCGNFLQWALELLVDDGRPGRALELLDERTDEYVKEHPDHVRDLRIWLLGEAGRYKEGILEATALNRRGTPPAGHGFLNSGFYVSSGRADSHLRGRGPGAVRPRARRPDPLPHPARPA